MLKYSCALLGLIFCVALAQGANVPAQYKGPYQAFESDQQRWEETAKNYDSLREYHHVDESQDEADDYEEGSCSAPVKEEPAVVEEVINEPSCAMEGVEAPPTEKNAPVATDAKQTNNQTETAVPQQKKETLTTQQSTDKAMPTKTPKSRRYADAGGLLQRNTVQLTRQYDTSTDTEKREYLLKTRATTPQTERGNGEYLRHPCNPLTWLRRFKSYEWVNVSGGLVRVLRMPGDGDCLFRAVRYQLATVQRMRGLPPVSELRKRVAAFLEKTKKEELVQNTILATAYEDPSLQSDHETDNPDDSERVIYADYNTDDEEEDDAAKHLVNKFIEKLGTTKCFGGMESLYALSQLYQVSIRVYNEHGTDFLIGQFPRGIQICYRLTSSGTRLHYDSVVAEQIAVKYIPYMRARLELCFYMTIIFKYKNFCTGIQKYFVLYKNNKDNRIKSKTNADCKDFVKEYIPAQTPSLSKNLTP